MTATYRPSRRSFIATSIAAGAGMTLAFHLPDAHAAVDASTPKPFVPNAWMRIDPNGTVTVTITKTEMGQGVRTSLPMILAEELEADWSRIAIVQATPNPAFRSLGTGGSWSIGGRWTPMRQAGAAAREMLITAAADRWGVDRTTCRAENGAVHHTPTGRRLGYGELAEAASALSVPESPPLKDPKDFRIIGKRLLALDGPSIVTGRAVYGFDMRVPGMRFATIARSPVFGGKAARWDAKRAEKLPGFRKAVPIWSGVAVVADDTWTALKARDALEVVWDEGPNRDFDSSGFQKRLEAESAQQGFVTRTEGQGAQALATATRRLEAVYHYPFQAHAPLEPMNTIADVRKDRCEIWSPTQAPDLVREVAVQLLGLPHDAVTVHVTLVGGGFGRRLGWDYAREAIELSKAIGEPVQVVWTREDDMHHGHFQSASAHRMAGGLDETGKVVAWTHTKAGTFHNLRGAPTPEQLKDPEHYRGHAWGSYDVPYSIPSIETSYVAVDLPVPHGPWRAVFSPSSTFARECFLDELAHAAGRDPLQMRLDLLAEGQKVKAGSLTLDQTRLHRVVKMAGERGDWGKPLPKGRGRGVACNIYDGDTAVAYLVEVTVDGEGRVKVDRVVAVVDPGLVVNPSGAEAQVEGGVLFGLSTALGGEITFRKGRVEQSNYRDYAVMRMDETPRMEIHLLSTTGSPTGMGEPTVPPIVPALANAIFAATGKRVRRLPIRPEDLR